MAIDGLGALLQNRRGFQNTILIVDRLSKLVQVVHMKRIRSVDVAEAVLEHRFF